MITFSFLNFLCWRKAKSRWVGKKRYIYIKGKKNKLKKNKKQLCNQPTSPILISEYMQLLETYLYTQSHLHNQPKTELTNRKPNPQLRKQLDQTYTLAEASENLLTLRKAFKRAAGLHYKAKGHLEFLTVGKSKDTIPKGLQLRVPCMAAAKSRTDSTQQFDHILSEAERLLLESLFIQKMIAYHTNRCFSFLNAAKDCRKADYKAVWLSISTKVSLHNFDRVIYEFGG